MATTKKEVFFTKSPTGKFKLAYSEGDVAKLDSKQADILIEAEYAVDNAEKQKREAAAAKEVEDAKKAEADKK